jgi:hypothetical protein
MGVYITFVSPILSAMHEGHVLTITFGPHDFAPPLSPGVHATHCVKGEGIVGCPNLGVQIGNSGFHPACPGRDR